MPGQSHPDKVNIHFRVHRDVKAVWLKAATAAGMDLTAWIQHACNKEVKERE